jgi:hypothetical protein
MNREHSSLKQSLINSDTPVRALSTDAPQIMGTHSSVQRHSPCPRLHNNRSRSALCTPTAPLRKAATVRERQASFARPPPEGGAISNISSRAFRWSPRISTPTANKLNFIAGETRMSRLLARYLHRFCN